WLVSVRSGVLGATLPPAPVLAKLIHLAVPGASPASSLTSPQTSGGVIVVTAPGLTDVTMTSLPSPEDSVIGKAIAAPLNRSAAIVRDAPDILFFTDCPSLDCLVLLFSSTRAVSAREKATRMPPSRSY